MPFSSRVRPNRIHSLDRSSICPPWASFCALIAVLLAFGPAVAQAAPKGSVILIIGDGMDDQQITIARNALVGVRGKLLLDEMPLRSAAQVLTVAEDDPKKVVYVADSANSGTSMATGAVTSRGRISTTAGTDRDIPTIVEMAQEAGLGTGLVATSSITDATPAVFAAHVSRRTCEDPETIDGMERAGRELPGCPDDKISAGGLGSISEQLATSGVDVLLGGGAKHFVPEVEGGGETVLDLAVRSGYQAVDTKAGMLNAGTGKPLLGLFSPSTMPTRMRGEDGRGAEKPDPSFLNEIHWLLGDVELPEPMRCEPNPEFGETPSLREMTDVALRHLEARETPFFLMVESASIDKAAHARNPCGSIGELEQLIEALGSALDFAKRHPGTLVLVTADHGQAAQIIPDGSLFGQLGIPVYTPGHLVRIETSEGAIMAINYATNDFFAEEHTGVAVPVYGNDVAVGIVDPFITQPDLFHLMAKHLDLAP